MTPQTQPTNNTAIENIMQGIKSLEKLITPDIQLYGDHIEINYSSDWGYILQASHTEIIWFYLEKEGHGIEQIGDEYYFPTDLNIDQIIADQSVIKDYANAHEKEWELIEP